MNLENLIYNKDPGFDPKSPVTAGLHGCFLSWRQCGMFFLQEMTDVVRQLTVSKAEKSGISSITPARCQEAPGTHMDSLISNRLHHEHGQEKRHRVDVYCTKRRRRSGSLNGYTHFNDIQASVLLSKHRHDVIHATCREGKHHLSCQTRKITRRRSRFVLRKLLNPHVRATG